MVKLGEIYHEPCGYLSNCFILKEWGAGCSLAYLYSFSFPLDSQGLLFGVSEDCHWYWLSPHWRCFCLFQWAWSGTSHPGEDCWRKDQARRHFLLWQGEKLVLKLFTLNPGFLWMGFLKEASAQHLAHFQTQHPLFFFPSISIMPWQYQH